MEIYGIYVYIIYIYTCIPVTTQYSKRFDRLQVIFLSCKPPVTCYLFDC